LKRFEIPGIFVLFLSLAFIMTAPLGWQLFTHTPAPPRDCLLNCWILSTEIAHLASPGPSFWDGNIFYPSQGTLTYSEHLIGYLPLAWLLSAVTKSMACSVNILTILSFALAGLGMYLLVRHLSGNPWAALCAGALFAFSPFRISHINHLNILAMHWLPFLFLFWHRALETGRFTDYGGFALFFVLEGLSCVQLSMYFFVLFPLLTLAEIWKMKKTTPALWRWGSAYCVIALVLLPFFLPYYRTLHSLGVLNTPYPDWSASMLSFLTPPGMLRLWGWLTPLLGKGQDVETYLFPGIVILLLTYAALRRFAPETLTPSDTKPATTPLFFRVLDALIAFCLLLIMALTLTGGFDLVIGPFPLSVHAPAILSTLMAVLLIARLGLDCRIRHKIKGYLAALPAGISVYFILVIIGVIFTFYGPFVLTGTLFPPLASIRVSARVFTIALVGLSVLAGFGFTALGEKWKNQAGLAALIVLLALLESFPFPLPLAPLPGEPWAALLRRVPKGSVIMILPLKDDEANAGYMCSPVCDGRMLINGYSGITPRYYEALSELFADFPSYKSKGALVQFGAGYVILDRAKIPPKKLMAMEEGLQGDSDFSLLYNGSESLLYRFNLHIKGLRPVRARILSPIKREGWKISAEPDKKLVEKSRHMIDDRLRTYWTTGRPVQKGDQILVDLGMTHPLAGCAFFHGTDFSFYLKTYQVHVSTDGKRWIMVARGWCDPPQFETYIRDPGNPYFFIPFHAREGRYIRIRSTDRGNYPWTVHELRAYSPWHQGQAYELLLVDPWRKTLPLLNEQE
jgi:hypothetical protein